MDAKRIFRTLAPAAALLLAGCEWFNAKPAARPESRPEDQNAEPPIVVQAPPVTDGAETEPPADEPRENIDTEVAQYIARVDDLATRVNNRPNSTLNSPVRPRNGAVRPADTRAVADSESESPTPIDAPTAATPPAAVTEAPRLAGVAIRAAAADEQPAAEGRRPAPTPAINAPISSGTATPAGLRSLLDALPTAGDNPSFRQQLDQRVANVLAGDYELARQPLTLVSNEQQLLSTRFVEALIAFREGHLGDPAAANTAALQAIEQLGDELRRGGDLRLPVVAVCSAVSGFGQYQPIEPPVFSAGAESEFVIYVEVRDFVSEKQDDGLFRTCFDLRTTVLNRAGDVVLEHSDTDVVDRCRNRRSDCFIPRLVRLPAILSPGEYVVKVSVTDKLGKKVAENCATIRVAAGR